MSIADTVLPGLKDFQRATVHHAFDRLYEAHDSTGRFLVADEVGLGKTMVARGVVAKAIDHLRDRDVKRIDVIYVCSNQVIARQNISKLMVIGEEHAPVLDRVTMLPAHLRALDEHEINLIPLTPQTSLDLRSAVGARRERTLLWYLLCDHFGEREMRKVGPKRVLQGPCRTLSSFEWGIQWDPYYHWSDESLEAGLASRFLRALQADGAQNGDDSMLARFERLAHSLKRRERNKPNSWELGKEANRLVGEMRRTLATSCIDGLEPDLVILDEFQRFRNLISPDDPTGELARMLFRHGDAKVLLLSATPYKMFTRDVEAEEDHHRDFLHTLDFLMDHDEDAREQCEGLLSSMRKGLRGLPESHEHLMRAKRRLERKLSSVIARTERLAVGGDRNGMVTSVNLDGLKLTSTDVESYAELDRVARAIEHPDIVEYWKSSPYPLNFMDEYVLSRDFEKAAAKDPDARLRRGALDAEAVLAFNEIDLGNARLRALNADTVERGYWKLLWLPPSLPYYEPGPPFAGFDRKPPTKRLVFSAWGVVPKALSLLLSYEAERRMVALGDEPRRNTAEGRKAVSQPLRIAKNSERTGAGTMTTLAFLMPTIALAEATDPLAQLREGDGDMPSLKGALAQARQNIRSTVRELTAGAMRSGPEDTSWYVAIPLLMEAQRIGGDALIAWLECDEVAATISSRQDPDDRDGSAWAMHLDEAANLVQDPKSLGRPPKDLLTITALIGLAGPGTAVVRALRRIAPDADESQSRSAALKIADALRGVFNWPEVVPLIRATDPTTRYWEDALRYCFHGNLQAVLDEFAHVLKEWAPIPGDKGPDDYVAGVREAMLEALALHGADYEVRRIGQDGVPEEDPLRMRPRFAIRFADPRASEDAQVDRATNVRASFNSPFWPFVLASTSVGQEGLDFHLYCHAIVHWNLPSNPVDFEQREGRVHRYKGHAVRINAAHLHGAAAFEEDGGDPWQAIFDAAEHRDGGLRPYWVLNEGPAKIERYVPALPWSRDSERRRLLEKLLASYRLAFGQPRQDDLLAFLGDLELSEDEIAELTIDLSPG